MANVVAGPLAELTRADVSVGMKSAILVATRFVGKTNYLLKTTIYEVDSHSRSHLSLRRTTRLRIDSKSARLVRDVARFWHRDIVPPT